MSLLPSGESVFLALLVGFLGVRPLLLMHLDVAWDAKGLKVGNSIADIFHLHRCACRLDRCLVVYVDGRCDDAFCQASLTERVRFEVGHAQLLPSLGV